MHATARLIVCEQTGAWAALARMLPGRTIGLRQTRSLDQCAEELRSAPASIAALELTAGNGGDLLMFLGDLSRQFPLACPVVLASGPLGSWEWLLREAGAVHVVYSPRHLAPLLPLVRRHMSRLPEPREAVMQRIWADLPWSE